MARANPWVTLWEDQPVLLAAGSEPDTPGGFHDCVLVVERHLPQSVQVHAADSGRSEHLFAQGQRGDELIEADGDGSMWIEVEERIRKAFPQPGGVPPLTGSGVVGEELFDVGPYGSPFILEAGMSSHFAGDDVSTQS